MLLAVLCGYCFGYFDFCWPVRLAGPNCLFLLFLILLACASGRAKRFLFSVLSFCLPVRLAGLSCLCCPLCVVVVVVVSRRLVCSLACS